MNDQDLTLKMLKYNSQVFDRIFGAFQPKQERREIIAPSSVLKNERRLYDDEFAFADRASWLDYHGIPAERRKPRNIVNECNHDEECLRRIAAAGCCTCEQQEVTE